MNFSIRIPLALAAGLIATTGTLKAETLQQLAGHTHYHGIAYARSGSAKLLLATHHGVFAVDAAGEATQVSPLHDYMGFSPDPADPLAYYASGHPSAGGNSGFLKSTDGGGSWQHISDGLNGPVDFHQLDVSAADPKTIYGGFGGLQVSHDGGVTWTMAGELPGELIAIAASGTKAATVYAATKIGLQASEDGGASWKSVAFPGEVVSLVEAEADGTLYAYVVGKGLMHTNESATGNWELLSNAFADGIPLHLAVDPSKRSQLALTTHLNGVWESSDGGLSWVQIGQ
jgi:photosystem II stability/assembly factor-like uncharacterized protein